MLETFELWNAAGYEQGFQTGIQEAAITSLVQILKECKKYAGSKNEKDQKMMKGLTAIVESSICPDQVKELETFIQRYPYLAKEQLVIRIIQESEYVYGCFGKNE